jgi:hypothetical protein
MMRPPSGVVPIFINCGEAAASRDRPTAIKTMVKGVAPERKRNFFFPRTS